MGHQHKPNNARLRFGRDRWGARMNTQDKLALVRQTAEEIAVGIETLQELAKELPQYSLEVANDESVIKVHDLLSELIWDMEEWGRE